MLVKKLEENNLKSGMSDLSETTACTKVKENRGLSNWILNCR